MIMTLTNKTTYSLNEQESKGVLDAIQSSAKFVIVQGDYVMLNSIVAIQSEDRAQEAERLRAGDYKCNFGKWHTRYDKCYGHDAAFKTNEDGWVALNDDNVRANRTPEEARRASLDKAQEVREILEQKGILKSKSDK